MTDPERLQAENRPLRAESVKAREDLALCQERLAYVLVELAQLRKKIPTTQIQAAAPVSDREANIFFPAKFESL